ncbi:unnamed protein product [Cyprideis torosa]|uniref:Uncharacterized protein n=1 Tax=Cyprideis torosa TaxID=163714 RepID=A0A7R8W389_9CRUS|nr:unnamed protein product [Cyprideis torosa]CAG0882790.1 unnamed protein product [Cyprideis torosa]
MTKKGGHGISSLRDRQIRVRKLTAKKENVSLGDIRHQKNKREKKTVLAWIVSQRIKYHKKCTTGATEELMMGKDAAFTFARVHDRLGRRRKWGKDREKVRGLGYGGARFLQEKEIVFRLLFWLLWIEGVNPIRQTGKGVELPYYFELELQKFHFCLLGVISVLILPIFTKKELVWCMGIAFPCPNHRVEEFSDSGETNFADHPMTELESTCLRKGGIPMPYVFAHCSQTGGAKKMQAEDETRLRVVKPKALNFGFKRSFPLKQALPRCFISNHCRSGKLPHKKLYRASQKTCVRVAKGKEELESWEERHTSTRFVFISGSPFDPLNRISISRNFKYETTINRQMASGSYDEHILWVTGCSLLDLCPSNYGYVKLYVLHNLAKEMNDPNILKEENDPEEDNAEEEPVVAEDNGEQKDRSLQSTLEKATVQYKNLQQANVQAQSQLSSAKEEADERLRQLELELSKTRAEFQSRVQVLEQDLNVLSREKNAVETEKNELLAEKRRLADGQSEAKISWENERVRWEAEKAGMERMKEALEQEKHGLELVKKGLEDEKKGLEDEKKGLEEEKKGLEEEKKGLEAEKKGLEAEKKGLEDEKKGLEDEKKGLEEEKKGLEAEKKGLEEEKRGLVTELEALKKEYEGLKQEQSGRDEERLGMQREKERLQTQNEDLLKERDGLRSDLQGVQEEQQKRLQEVEIWKSEVERQRDELRSENEALRETNSKLEERLKEEESKGIAVNSEELDSLRTRLREVEGSESVAKEELRELKANLAAKSEELSSLRSSVAAEKESLEASLKASQQKNEELRRKNYTVLEALQRTESDLIAARQSPTFPCCVFPALDGVASSLIFIIFCFFVLEMQSEHAKTVAEIEQQIRNAMLKVFPDVNLQSSQNLQALLAQFEQKAATSLGILRKEREDLKAERDSLAKEKQELAASLACLQSFEKAADEVCLSECLNTIVTTVPSIVHELQEKLEELQTKLKTEAEEKENYRSQLSEANQSCDSLRSQLSEVDDVKRKLEEEREAKIKLSDEISELKEQLKTCKQNVEDGATSNGLSSSSPQLPTSEEKVSITCDENRDLCTSPGERFSLSPRSTPSKEADTSSLGPEDDGSAKKKKKKRGKKK